MVTANVHTPSYVYNFIIYALLQYAVDGKHVAITAATKYILHAKYFRMSKWLKAMNTKVCDERPGKHVSGR